MPLREKESFADPLRVRAVAATLALSGPVSVGQIAAQLGASSRTLQRQLADQGVSLRAIVEESRLEIARVLLCKTDLDVQEIAARSGYSTPSGFSRAFARWAGCAPRIFRRKFGRPTKNRNQVARNGRTECS
ncbi:helix-turn-helix domain-containing protein [Roseibium aggregatum]|uniref:helix-turn-helix domain-containing protein n=1 Tax=Roseibium aggregatum TaxID=187304 RepID=UPI003A97C7CE